MENDNFKKNSKTVDMGFKYNSTSQYYDNRYANIQLEKYQYILKDFNLKNTVILDAGCGTGLLYSFISEKKSHRQFTTLQYVGIDVSKEMLTRFKKRIKKLYSNEILVELVLGDIQNLPFRKNAFNVVLSVTAIQNLENLEQGLIELLNSTKQSCELRISVLNKKDIPFKLKSVFARHGKKYSVINDSKTEDSIFIVNNKN